MKTLETPRLILREFQLSDARDLFDYAKLATVGPMAGWAPHKKIEDSIAIITHFIAKNDVWALWHKADNKVIGSLGMHDFVSTSGELCKELGYVLSTPYEGQGLMTEACLAAIDHVFKDTGIQTIWVSHFIENQKSARVIQRLGFRYVKESDYVTQMQQVKPAKYYIMTKKDYLKEEHMNTTWNLDKLYKGFDTDEFQADVTRFESLIDQLKELAFPDYQAKEKRLEAYLSQQIDLYLLASKLFSYASLIQSTDSTNRPALKYLNRLDMKMTDLTITATKFKKWLKDYPEIDQDIAKNPFLKEHEFILKEMIQEASHLFDDKTENLVAKLQQTGSTAWERLQALLTSTLEVDYDGKEVTLSQVRNMAYSDDPEVRRKAFEAEIAAYKKIEKPIAYAINGIKGEVNTLLEERGYRSVLDYTLEQNRLGKETLDVMLETMEAYLPHFWAYLKRKAELLGHSQGLPFYDLFAPMGKTQKKFTIPEAGDYILKNFGTFSPRLHDMASRAFKDGWIDFLPKKGKVGGAFCANLVSIKESRVLTNFDGAFGDVITLAHELGHAYHGEAIFGESVLNAEYSMPVAETASTFCETIVNKAAFRDATSDDERIFLLESSLQDSTQVIVDILSRYYFESALFEGRKTTLYDENELKNMMLDAQTKAYGDGLDPDKRHPYMWLCKSHYYSGNLSFYNFPYAFGLLFAKGLYAKYLENKDHFVKLYDDLLASTGKSTAEDTAKIANIDITKKDFWKGSLDLLKEDIDLFLHLTEK